MNKNFIINYKYTIIIPHKNIPILLERCLNSIPKREDIQVIVVDDNSILSEESIKHFPGINRYNTEVYFTKKGKGAGYARNIGLSHAKGKWVLFADADDIFLPEIEYVLNNIDENVDIIHFGICSKDSESLEITNEDTGYNRILREAVHDPKSIKYRITNPWSKIYKKELIDKYNIRFEEVKFANDVKFSTLCDYYSKSHQIIPNKAYCYMYRPNSLWHQKGLEWATTRFKVFINISKFFRKNSITEKIEYYNNEAYLLLKEIQNISKHKYLLYLFKYGIHIKSFKIIFIQIPITLMHYMRIKLGIKNNFIPKITRKIMNR